LNFDAKKAGVDAEVVKMMVDHFSWELDFSRDLRKGDRFVLSWNGGKTPEAMIYIGDRKTIALFSHIDTQGRKKYYTANGLTINDTFAFAPVKYNRISSGFSKRRWHPTLKTYRPHRGTDFAAPTGTPVYAPAKGLVKYVATLSGYGNVIYLKHGSELVTVYAHLSKFAKGLKAGNRVKKGELIGYVGSTGMSTGPHLHYEIRVNGIHKDAEKISLEKRSAVPNSKMSSFQKRAKRILFELNIK
jgi:murein DD-endopeptidase MepM/ murein hydrolase activator NlpD